MGNEFWIVVDGYENLPSGNWLIRMEEEVLGSDIQVATVQTVQSSNPNKESTQMAFIAGRFGFDCPKVIEYRPLPL